MKLLREIFTRDNALHIPLGAAVAALVWVLCQIPSPWCWPAIGNAGLYLREVIQFQTRVHGGDIRTGWGLDLHQHMEWAAPGVALFALTGLWELIH
jgi:hypothetical protein